MACCTWEFFSRCVRPSSFTILQTYLCLLFSVRLYPPPPSHLSFSLSCFFLSFVLLFTTVLPSRSFFYPSTIFSHLLTTPLPLSLLFFLFPGTCCFLFLLPPTKHDYLNTYRVILPPHQVRHTKKDPKCKGKIPCFYHQ